MHTSYKYKDRSLLIMYAHVLFSGIDVTINKNDLK